jgi:hypothetical protein
MMASQCAVATRPEETRFRIEAANSRPRAIKVIALDCLSERTVERLANLQWNGATFFTASAFSVITLGERRFSVDGWLKDLGGRTKDLIDEVSTADLVVMVAAAGADGRAASIIGEACSLKRVTTTALVLSDATVSEETLSRTLAPLRPWAVMLVVANEEDYVADMLASLRA